MDARAAETQDEWALLAQCVGQFQEISAQLRDEKHKVVFKQQREEAREKRRRERQTRGNPSLEADLQSLISSNPDKEDQIRALQRLEIPIAEISTILREEVGDQARGRPQRNAAVVANVAMQEGQ
mmetsp:Transcript_17977/g.68148  ORF Transcript_17977/g.68148 Transcript_17977/m.68148 type:complete len:125 (-) Transcript_17977:122-496(-)